MKDIRWPGKILLILATIGCFHLAFWKIEFTAALIPYFSGLLMIGFFAKPRASFYSGLLVGMGIFSFHLAFLADVFNSWLFGFILWFIVSFWHALFCYLVHLGKKNLPTMYQPIGFALFWFACEFFRSEIYFLRFSWVNAGWAFADAPFANGLGIFGVYGMSFVLVLIIAYILQAPKKFAIALIFLLTIQAGIWVNFSDSLINEKTPASKQGPLIAGIQFEDVDHRVMLRGLDKLKNEHPDADIYFLSECSIIGPPTVMLKHWCRTNGKYLLLGGSDPIDDENYYNTAFIISPEGKVCFKQAKVQPIQFFSDGLPAKEQKVWDSPWGKIGVCICYDMSYSFVIDELINQGAQAILSPTMDVKKWGAYEHHLHSRVPRVRASEYGIPIFRVCSSGISQFIDKRGNVLAEAGFPGKGEMLAAHLPIAQSGQLPVDRYLSQIALWLTAAFMAVVFIKSRRAKALENKKK